MKRDLSIDREDMEFIIVAANGFEGVSKFASKCVSWMIILFLLEFFSAACWYAEAFVAISWLAKHDGVWCAYCWIV